MNKIVFSMILSTVLLTARQSNKTPNTEVTKTEKVNTTDSISLIQAKTERIHFAKDEVCYPASEEEYASCTKYHLQNVKTH